MNTRENASSAAELTLELRGRPIEVVFADSNDSDEAPESAFLDTLANLLIDQHERERASVADAPDSPN